MALPGLIDTLAVLLAGKSLLRLTMTWRRRYLTQSNILSIPSLAWSLALHLLFCFSQEKSLRWKEIYMHTHPRAHTHTHTHTHTHIHKHTQTHMPLAYFNCLPNSICWTAFGSSTLTLFASWNQLLILYTELWYMM